MIKKPTHADLEKKIQELEQAKEAHKQSEEQYRSLVENTIDGYFICEIPSGKFIFLNRKACSFFGYKMEEGLKMSIWEVISPEDHERILMRIQARLEGEPLGSELNAYTAVHKDGTTFFAEISTSLVSHRGVPTVQGIIRDITERKQSEESVKASEERFRSIVNASPMGVHMYELQEENRLVFVGANRASDKILGVGHEQFIGKTIEGAFPGLVETEVPDQYREAARAGKIWRTEQINYEEGKIRGAFEVVAFQTEQNKMAAFFHDITARKQIEEALRESEEKYRNILENIDDGYFEVDIAGNFTFFNDSMCKIIRYPKNELMGMNNREYMDEENAKLIFQTFNNVYQSGLSTKALDWKLNRKDGTECFVETVVSLIKNQNGNGIGFRGVARDITERKQLEYQFQQAMRMESIGTLAGGIAHDFNNLLMGIQGRAFLALIDKDPSHPDFEHLKGIEDYVISAVDLTKQLLGFARGGKYEVKATDINKMIKKTSRMFGRTKKEIKIHTKHQKAIWTVEIDQGQIEQVLMNLYVNAWQAMPDGGDLYIQTANVELDENDIEVFDITNGRYVKISVTDTGIGMDQATQKRIFEPFFTTKEMGRGTGLGLASAYGIIRNHGGFINVYSEIGKGTAFYIYLPLSKKKVVEEKQSTGTVEKGEGTILLVDDEEIIIDVGRQLLNLIGYKVMTAKSGKEALEVYEQNMRAIDMVILDMIMPGMSGGETYDRLKENNADLKILLSSGYSIDGQAQEIIDRGCNGFIQKPFSMKDISIKIAEILDKDKPIE